MLAAAQMRMSCEQVGTERVGWGIGLNNGHATMELFSCGAFHARLVGGGSCWAPVASHEPLHSDAVPVSGRSTAVPSGM